MAAASGPAACAPWRPALQSHICKMPSPEFVFSTVARDEQGRCVPRARYCGFRGFFGELQLHQEAERELKQQEKEHDKDAPTNPPVFESDMPTITTDVRMEKVENLASSGGAVEAVFWIKEVMTQWRIKGKAFVIGGSPEEKEEREAREEVKKGMRMRDAGGTAVGGEWSWEREITMYFANHTPVMRGLFCFSFLFILCLFICSWNTVLTSNKAPSNIRPLDVPSPRYSQTKPSIWARMYTTCMTLLPGSTSAWSSSVLRKSSDWISLSTETRRGGSGCSSMLTRLGTREPSSRKMVSVDGGRRLKYGRESWWILLILGGC